MNWNDNRSALVTLAILGDITRKCAELGGPVSQILAEMVSTGQYPALLAYEIDYSSIGENDAVYARQIQGFFQKLGDLNLGVDKAETAAKRFLQSEISCLETNRRLAYHRRKPHLRAPHIDIVFHYAMRKIDAILSSCPSLDLLEPSFGPGANTNVKSAVACPRAKLSARLECSYEMSPTAAAFLYETPRWTALHSVDIDEDRWLTDVTLSHGKLIFVPKNAKTDRSIVIEPILNSFHQKGVGSYLKTRLLHSGIDLYDQSINQRAALRGSIDNSLATIDLSMASDCLSLELVHELLPPDWTDLLARLRTGYVWLPDSVTGEMFEKHYAYRSPCENAWIPATFDPITHKYEDRLLKLEKFSSMGNGYTFELESLIFYSLVYGVCRSLHLPVKDISVFGDDLIVPKAAVSRLTEVLNYCGFTVNSEKSYSSGPFRESCGADYLNGMDIRPFYQKSLISDRTLYSMHNWFIRHGEYQLAASVIPHCNPAYFLWGPDGYGDGHLIGSFNLRYPRNIKRSQWGGGYFDTYALRSKRFKTLLPGDAELPSYSVYTRSGKLSETDPDVVRGSAGYAKLSIYTLANSIFAR